MPPVLILVDKHTLVCVPPDRAKECVKHFGCYTSQLYALADWLAECGIETVAMESTGVYGIPLLQILETRGFEVKLVNAHHVKTLPGGKSDVWDCQWLQQLHSYGLLSSSFRPEDQVCVLLPLHPATGQPNQECLHSCERGCRKH